MPKGTEKELSLFRIRTEHGGRRFDGIWSLDLQVPKEIELAFECLVQGRNLIANQVGQFMPGQRANASAIWRQPIMEENWQSVTIESNVGFDPIDTQCCGLSKSFELILLHLDMIAT